MQQFQQPYAPAPADPMAYVANLDARMRALETRLPNTSLVAPSFIKRSFAVWGHMFVSSFIIGTIFSIIGFVLSLLFAGGLMSMFNQLGSGGGF